MIDTALNGIHIDTAPEDGAQLRVLVVADSSHNAAPSPAPADHSSYSTITVTKAGRLDQALELLSTATFDAVLLDLDLPDSRGVEAVQKLRHHAPGVALVVRTAADDAVLGRESVRLGAQDFLARERTTPELLVRSLELAVERRRRVEAEAALRKLTAELAPEQTEEQPAGAVAGKLRDAAEEILESVTDAFFALDREWRLTYVNARGEALMGRPRSAVLGHSVWELFPALEGRSVHRALQRVMDERSPVDFDFPSAATPGVWLRLHATPTSDGAVVYVRDVTRGKEAEERSRFQAHLLDAIGQAVIATAADGTIRYWNRAAETLYGWSADEVLGRNVLEITPAQVTRAQAAEIVEHLSEGRSWAGEFTVQRRDGAEFPAWVSDTPILAEDGSLEAIIGISFDISERKAAEAALREERRRLADAQRVARLGSWEVDLHTGTFTWSDEQFRIRGREPQSFTPTFESFLVDVHPADREWVVSANAAIMQNPAPYEGEYRVVRPDGSVRVLLALSEVLRDERGAPLRLVGTDQDITERKEREEATRRLAAALDASVDGICIVSRDGLLDYVNPAKAECFRYGGADELLGRSWSVTYPDDEVQRFEEEILPMLELSGWWQGEIVGLRTDGSTFPMEMSITRLEGGGWVGVDRDVTNRKRAEDELRRRGEMVRLLQAAATAANESATLEQALHMVVGQVCDLTYLQVGHAYVAADNAGELIPTNIWCTSDPARIKPFQRATLDTRFRSGEGLPGRVLDAGCPIWVPDIAADPTYPRWEAAGEADLHAAIAFPVLAGAEVVAVLEFFTTDRRPPDRLLLDTLGNVGTQLGRVAERMRAEAELRAAREESERANRAKSEFLSRMSHELRTPLNAILGFGQLLEADVDREEDRESVDLILRAGRHLLALIDEVLDLARIEAGQMSLSVEPISVRDAVEQSLSLIRHMATERGIAITEPSDADLAHYVCADLQRLKQVLLNLLSNAIKYNRRDGSVTVSCEEASDAKLRIVVRDTGFGIEPEKLQRLFVPFDRLGAELGTVEGTGLGLALSRGLMEAMGGALGVESEPGIGTRFWAELLPAKEDDAQVSLPQVPGSVSAPRETADEAIFTVLVIEDNLANVRLMERIFRRRPHVHLLVAMQGSIGLELARQHRPGLILLDVNLPGISGREVLRELQRDAALRQIPVVMVSGDAMPENVERLKEEGADGYITKPFDLLEVLGLVDEKMAARGA